MVLAVCPAAANSGRLRRPSLANAAAVQSYASSLKCVNLNPCVSGVTSFKAIWALFKCDVRVAALVAATRMCARLPHGQQQ